MIQVQERMDHGIVFDLYVPFPRILVVFDVAITAVCNLIDLIMSFRILDFLYCNVKKQHLNCKQYRRKRRCQVQLKANDVIYKEEWERIKKIDLTTFSQE